MSIALPADDTVSPSLGAMQPLKLPAHRYQQGGRITYSVPLSLAMVRELVERPDPQRPLPGNRIVSEPRAKAFSEYLGDNNFVCPPLGVRVHPDEVTFTQHWGADGIAWGEISIPRNVLTRILDGQHRTLGIYIREDVLREKIEKQRNAIAGAEQNGNKDILPELRRTLKKYQDQHGRLSSDFLTVEIIEATGDEGKQMFVDIARNAKGVNPDFTTELDQRSVTNRIAVELAEEHPLLQNRVETGQTRPFRGQSNPNLMGAKGVADIVRGVLVGGSGRVGKNKEEEFTRNQADASARVKTFLDILLASFEDLRAVKESEISPIDLRKESMLGSLTVLRVLAAAYHELTKPKEGDDGVDPMSRSETQTFFRSLEPKLREIPIEQDGLWASTGFFQVGASAPLASQGAIAGLTKQLVSWAREGLPK